MWGMDLPDFAPTIERFTGFADHYDAVRPAPPAALGELLSGMAGFARKAGEDGSAGQRAGLVVDLGCGTGLSTRYWSGRAEKVIGVEPSASMRAQAESLPAEGVEYREGFSHATGLPDAAADIVCCCQALHWMEPVSTFREAARVLREGGVFAACDYDWPPATLRWEADAAYEKCLAWTWELEREWGIARSVTRWGKEGHLARMGESGVFRRVVECVLHHRGEGGADLLVDVLLSQGHVRSLLKRGLTEADLKINALRDAAARAFRGETTEWFWSSRVRIGIR